RRCRSRRPGPSRDRRAPTRRSWAARCRCGCVWRPCRTLTHLRWAAVTVWLPTSIDEAISALSDPEAQVLAGGTDFLVEVNAGHRRPDSVVGLGRIRELQGWQHTDGWVRLGAGVTYSQMLQPDLAGLLPAL